MSINVSGLTDSQLLEYNSVCTRLSGGYTRLKENLGGDSGLSVKVAEMKEAYDSMKTNFDKGYKEGGKTYTAIKNAIDNLGELLDSLESTAGSIVTECETRIDFYNCLRSNIITKRNEVANKYSEKEYKSDWRLISNTVIAAKNNSKAEEKNNIRYSIYGSTVSYS